MSTSQVRTASRISMQAGPNHSNALRPTCVILVSRGEKERWCTCTCLCHMHVCGCAIVLGTEGCLVEQPVIRGVPNLIFA